MWRSGDKSPDSDGREGEWGKPCCHSQSKEAAELVTGIFECRWQKFSKFLFCRDSQVSEPSCKAGAVVGGVEVTLEHMT